MSRKEAIQLVDEAFKKCWNPHTTAQVDNNIRDVLYDVVAKLLERMTTKEKRHESSRSDS